MKRRRDVIARREAVTTGKAARVAFDDEGAVEMTWSFESAAELADFAIPGPEWKVENGRLSSTITKGERSDKPIPADRFRNRPGVVADLPISSKRAARVSFDVELPYSGPDPGLFGVRLFSTCFVIRSFADRSFPGQVNAWSGDLDDFGDHLFDPALGETRPRKRSAGPVREFELKRGERYRFVIEWMPGRPNVCTLRVDGAVVYQFRTDDAPRAAALELRSETPILVDDLTVNGVAAGAALKGAR